MWIQTKNSCISIICVLLMVGAPTHVYAQDTPSPPPKTDLLSVNLGKVSQLRKGQHAPFAGVLLSDTAAARLFGEIKFSERECNLRLSRELKINTLQFTSQLDALKLRLDIENTRTTALLGVKDERVKFLEKNWRPTPWYESGEFWFSMGIVSGILITVASAYALGQAAK